MNIKIWFRALRVPFFTATVIPVCFGSIAAWHDTGSFRWGLFFLALFGAVLIHAGTNLANDYFDHRTGCDEGNSTPTPFSGGSRVIQEKLISPKKMLLAALITFSLGSGIGLYLNHILGQNVILIIGIIGVFLGFFYTAGPLRIGYASLGELSIGIGFGPLMVMGSYYVQAQTLSFREFLISIPIGILIALVVFINEFPDYNGDLSVGKKTLVVMMGKKKAVILYHWLLSATYLCTILLIMLKMLPLFCLIIFLSLPLALKAFWISKKNYEMVYELLPANASTIGLHSLIGVLLCVGFVLDKIW